MEAYSNGPLGFSSRFSYKPSYFTSPHKCRLPLNVSNGFFRPDARPVTSLFSFMILLQIKIFIHPIYCLNTIRILSYSQYIINNFVWVANCKPVERILVKWIVEVPWLLIRKTTLQCKHFFNWCTWGFTYRVHQT